MEKKSEHPLAEAIVTFLKNSSTMEVEQFGVLSGRGVEGMIDHKKYYAGNLVLLQEKGITMDEALMKKAETWSHEAKTVIALADRCRRIRFIYINFRK